MIKYPMPMAIAYTDCKIRWGEHRGKNSSFLSSGYVAYDKMAARSFWLAAGNCRERALRRTEQRVRVNRQGQTRRGKMKLTVSVQCQEHNLDWVSVEWSRISVPQHGGAINPMFILPNGSLQNEVIHISLHVCISVAMGGRKVDFFSPNIEIHQIVAF
jgi:hypothetical protein